MNETTPEGIAHTRLPITERAPTTLNIRHSPHMLSMLPGLFSVPMIQKNIASLKPRLP